jgi:hypothetical protein
VKSVPSQRKLRAGTVDGTNRITERQNRRKSTQWVVVLYACGFAAAQTSRKAISQ